jgi:hypothetical protein
VIAWSIKILVPFLCYMFIKKICLLLHVWWCVVYRHSVNFLNSTFNLLHCEQGRPMAYKNYAQSVQKLPDSMKFERSLPCSQKPTTEPYVFLLSPAYPSISSSSNILFSDILVFIPKSLIKILENFRTFQCVLLAPPTPAFLIQLQQK